MLEDLLAGGQVALEHEHAHAAWDLLAGGRVAPETSTPYALLAGGQVGSMPTPCVPASRSRWSGAAFGRVRADLFASGRVALATAKGEVEMACSPAARSRWRWPGPLPPVPG
jgi:hypothetical protein